MERIIEKAPAKVSPHARISDDDDRTSRRAEGTALVGNRVVLPLAQTAPYLIAGKKSQKKSRPPITTVKNANT
jgi:hypothetical protein